MIDFKDGLTTVRYICGLPSTTGIFAASMAAHQDCTGGGSGAYWVVRDRGNAPSLMRGLSALNNLAKLGIPHLRRYGRKNDVVGTLQLNGQLFAGQPDLAKVLAP